MDGYDEMLSDLTENGLSAAFWMSLISMIQIFLNFQKSIKTGNWQLHFQSISSMLLWMHAYDRQNYSRHLTYNLVTQQNLEVTHPNIFKEFLAGTFSGRRKLGSFNKVPSDQVVEQTINKDLKGSGGIVGFSTSESRVQRWIVLNHIISHILGDFQQSLDLLGEDNKCEDVLACRMELDEDKVKSAYDLLTSWGNPFKPSESLTNLSGVTHVSDRVLHDLLLAEKIERNQLQEFVGERTESNKKSFYAPIKQNKLQAFASLRINKDVKAKEKTVAAKSSYQVFSRFMMIQQSRQVSMRDIVEYKLGPVPWAFAKPTGERWSTSKSKIIKDIKTEIPLTTSLPENTARIFDAMVLIQQLPEGVNTFGDVSDHLLNRITKNTSRCVFLVSDQYGSASIKSLEREGRSSSGQI